MTDKKKIELMRKRNADLARKLDSLSEKIQSELDATIKERDNYIIKSKQLEDIKNEFYDLLGKLESAQSDYDRLITQAKEMKKIVFNDSWKVKIPFVTRLRLFYIKHRH